MLLSAEQAKSRNALRVFKDRFINHPLRARYWVLLGLFVLLIAGIFAVAALAATSPALGVAGLAIWTFINGLAIGPAVNIYAATIGWQTVTFSFMGTAAIMAVLGCWGAFSGRDFSAWGKWLFVGLLGLIVVGVIAMFTGFGQSFNLLYSLAGMVIFAGYFVFDFFRLSRSEDNDFNAVMLTMSIYLDFVNFWLSLMRFIAASKN